VQHSTAKAEIQKVIEIRYWNQDGKLIQIPPHGFTKAADGFFSRKVTAASLGPETPIQVDLVPPYGSARAEMRVRVNGPPDLRFGNAPEIRYQTSCQAYSEEISDATSMPVEALTSSATTIIYSASSGAFRSDVLRLRPHYLSERFARLGFNVKYFPLSDSLPNRDVEPGLEQLRRSDFFQYVQDVLSRNDPPGIFICSSLPDSRTILLLDRIKERGWKILYEVRDDPEGMKSAGANYGLWYNVYLERKLCQLADVVIVVSGPLRDRAIALGAREDRVFVYPNGIEDDLLHHVQLNWAPENIAKRREVRKVVGYFGHMFGGRFDVDAVVQAAHDLPDVQFELVGPGLQNPERLDLRNVKQFGQRSVEEFFEIAQSWDIGILPFKVNRITFSIDPIKYYQYLACGLKVVHSDVHNLRGAPLCFLYDAERSLSMVLREVLSVEVTEHDGAAISKYLANSTWEKRAAATLRHLGYMPEMGGVTQ
jgi:glycosyltransferase involved in cell wall biosynthesis